MLFDDDHYLIGLALLEAFDSCRSLLERVLLLVGFLHINYTI